MKIQLFVMLAILSTQAFALEDGFEGSGLASFWRTDLFEAGRVTIQSDIVRSGKQALRIDLQKFDRYEPGDEESLPSERTEIGENISNEALEDSTHEYSFSHFIPADFPIADVRLNLAQWKERCLLRSCNPENALIAVQYINGELIIKRQHTKKSEKIFRTKADIRNQWTDFKFRIKYSKGQDGMIEAWMNGVQIVNYKGITTWPEGSIGYRESGNTFYFKMGLYRDQMDPPMTIYVDDYKRVQILP